MDKRKIEKLDINTFKGIISTVIGIITDSLNLSYDIFLKKYIDLNDSIISSYMTFELKALYYYARDVGKSYPDYIDNFSILINTASYLFPDLQLMIRDYYFNLGATERLNILTEYQSKTRDDFNGIDNTNDIIKMNISKNTNKTKSIDNKKFDITGRPKVVDGPSYNEQLMRKSVLIGGDEKELTTDDDLPDIIKSMKFILDMINKDNIEEMNIKFKENLGVKELIIKF